MAKFLFVWEMGANYGHISALLPPALALRRQGYDIVFSVQKPIDAERLTATYGFPSLLSPRLVSTSATGQPLHSYPDILLQTGFDNPHALLQAVLAWKAMFAHEKPDVLVLNSAPTAALAARNSSMKTVLYGHGFDLPPQTYPLPAMRAWMNMPTNQLLGIETRVLNSINAVMMRLKQAPLQRLTELMQADERMLTTVRELDHYPQRAHEKYWGLVTTNDEGESFQWHGTKKYKIFAYLRANAVNIETIAHQMQDPQCEYVLVAPDISDAECIRFSGDHRRVRNRPVKLEDVMPECSAAICHASISTTTAFLLHGVPLLMLPSQIEQFLMGRNAAQRNYGVLLNPQDPQLDITRTLRQLLREPIYRIKAKEFAQKYQRSSRQDWLVHIVARLCELANASERTASQQSPLPSEIHPS